MINGIQVKVCGITSLIDAEAADRVGADFLGFDLSPKSPRHVPVEVYHNIVTHLPYRKKIAVMTEPREEELRHALAIGFSLAQIHLKHTTPLEQIEKWSRTVGARHLWLAPELPPEMDVPGEWLPLADGFLLDPFCAGENTRDSGDWQKFARHREAHPDNLWILSGGLTADNAGEAVNKSGARFVNVSGGVEISPGVKNADSLEAFARALRQR
ncbi:phosphoribosylanthranilate isomerase [Ereboglobus sp. PH5-5]|uniref:phosphoribosylanthranilate isomerase n=1 Tax=unclassified Ereboglobus TaxID=2626932 RepID=UPI002405CE5B|nr:MULTISPECIES: phosphoribosylanthranilate isomerase [unclassified Ereboglobus]MDF9826936.1 phosphoribosylanthranilate isomerase [Ereboglobus sp. PH5-10]MDF9831957.1 phosphoribosylanthranilate isomerase [Ereboglobus sp. PH5-5]